MEAQTLSGGFADPALSAAHAFRAVMEAMARPGTVHTITGAQPPAPMSPAAGAALLTLCDTETPLHLAGAIDCAPVRDWIAFHTGAPIADAASCSFALGSWEALSPLSTYPVGVPAYPDRSATLIVELDVLIPTGATLQGPGIKSSAQLSLPEIAAFQTNARHFPLGLDFLFTCDDQIAALPRTTQVF